MAIVYPAEDPTMTPGAPESSGQRLMDFAEQHVVLAGALIIGLALAIGFVINKLRGGSASSTANQQPQTLYVPTSTTYQNNYTTTDSNNTTNNPPPVNNPPPAGGCPPGYHAVAITGVKGGPSGITCVPDGPGPGPQPKPGPTWITEGAQGAPPVGSSIDEVAAWYHESLSQLQSDNPWDAGYNVDLAGNVNNQEFKISGGTGRGADPFLDGHRLLPSSIFAFNHAVHQHVNNVVGA